MRGTGSMARLKTLGLALVALSRAVVGGLAQGPARRVPAVFLRFESREIFASELHILSELVRAEIARSLSRSSRSRTRAIRSRRSGSAACSAQRSSWSGESAASATCTSSRSA